LGLAVVALAVTRPWQKTAVPEISSISVDSLANQQQGQPTAPPTPATELIDTQPADTQPAVSQQPRQQPSVPRPAPRANTPAAVTAPQVSSVSVSGLTTLTVGGISALLADARDAQGRVMGGRTVVWQSNAPGVVSVNSSGQLSARSTGRATVTATIDGVSHAVTITVNPEPVAAQPPPVTRESTPSAPAVPAGPTDAELKAQVGSTIQAYAAALESGNIARVRQMYPGMASERERQLRLALPEMGKLQVQLTVGQVDLNGDHATARVTGRWVFNQGGQRNVLPADNTYILDRRGAGWVITEIR
jgi:hypothetical protein